MARSKIQVVQLRRKKEGKTDYRKRLKLLLANKPRLVIRKSLNNTWLQVVEYSPAGDRVVLSAHSRELKGLGWNLGYGNLPAAYLTGFLLGKKAAGKKVGKCVLDIGLYPSVKGARLYAALKGAADAGMDVPFSKDILPSDDRIKGKHIADFFAKIKPAKGDEKQFSVYLKNNVNPEDVAKQFEDVKKKIEGRKNG